MLVRGSNTLSGAAVATIPEPVSKLVETRLSLIVRSDVLGSFCLLTGGGFRVGLRSPCTIRELLCGHLGVEPDYLRDRIQTIFLDAKAVDEPESAIVAAGSTVALSSAMPGLAGATLRKGGRLASLRSQISHQPTSIESMPEQPGDVTVKLFNLLQQELGPDLLNRGIRIPGKPLANLLLRRPGSLRPGILTAEIDARGIPVSTVFTADWASNDVCLSIAAQD